MPVESHVLMDRALHVYRREGSRFWQCATYLGSRNRVHLLPFFGDTALEVRHPSDRQELQHQRRDDREILRAAFEEQR